MKQKRYIYNSSTNVKYIEINLMCVTSTHKAQIHHREKLQETYVNRELECAHRLEYSMWQRRQFSSKPKTDLEIQCNHSQNSTRVSSGSQQADSKRHVETHGRWKGHPRPSWITRSGRALSQAVKVTNLSSSDREVLVQVWTPDS